VAFDDTGDQTLDRRREHETKTDILNKDEHKSLQEDAVTREKERKEFLKDSYFSPRSPSTEAAARVLIEIYDGAKQLLGYGKDGAPKASRSGLSARAILEDGGASAVREGTRDTGDATKVDRQPTFTRDGQEDPNAKPPTIKQFLDKQIRFISQGADRIVDDFVRVWSNPYAVIEDATKSAEDIAKSPSEGSKAGGSEAGLNQAAGDEALLPWEHDEGLLPWEHLPGEDLGDGIRAREYEESRSEAHTDKVDEQKVKDAYATLKNLTPEELDAVKKLWAENNKDAASSADLLDKPPTTQLDIGEPRGLQDSSTQRGLEEGAVGDRSRDSGAVTVLEKPEVTKTTIAGKERVTGYELPDGGIYKIGYDDKGEPTSLTMPDSYGKPVTYEKGDKNNWVDKANPKNSLAGLTVDDKGNLVIATGDEAVSKVAGDKMHITISPDGSFKQWGSEVSRKYSEIESDGTVHIYRHEDILKLSETVTEVVTKPGSHISEVKTFTQDKVNDASAHRFTGYEIKDDQGHVTKVDVDPDGGVFVSTGDQTPAVYAKVEQQPNGDLTLTAKDGSTLEVKTDGTSIHRDRSGHVTEITDSEGEKTSFKRSGTSVTEVTITDSQGHVIDKQNKGIEINDKDGTYTVALDKDHKLERKADGTEHTLVHGQRMETETEKLIERFRYIPPEQAHQLRQDLADIDKLPKEQREAIYKSLDKIAAHDPDGKFKLDDQQALELTCSLAHQIAHPESIQQGAHESCAAANMEIIMAKTHPGRYADMVSKLATEGKYEFPGPPPKTVTAENHEGRLDPKSDVYGKRSYSSELFQDAAIQLAVYPKSYKSLPLDSPDIQPRPKDVTPATDFGEREFDPKNPSAPPETFTGLTKEEQLQAYKELFPGEHYGEKSIKTPADLQAAFDQNGPPMKVGISLEGDKAKTGMGGEAGTLAGNHAVIITKIENGKVYYENTAGGTDHSYPNGAGVPIKDFTDAMTKAEKGAYVKGYEGKGGDTGKGHEGSMGMPADGPSGLAKDAGASLHSDAARADLSIRHPFDSAYELGSALGHRLKGDKPADKPPDKPADKPLETAQEKTPEQQEQAEKQALQKLKEDPDVKGDYTKLHDRVEELAKAGKISEQERKDFEDNMDKFEARSAKLQQQYVKEFEAQGMKPDDAEKAAEKKAHEQVEKSFQNIEKMLENNANAPLNEKDRILLAEQTMQHAADTTTVKQGNHGTCNVAVLESRTYTMDPAEATRMMADMATTGKYASHGTPPVTVELDKRSFEKDQQSNEHPTKDGHRDYSSQLFQTTAVNIHYQLENAKTTPPGQLHYEYTGPPKAGSPPDDNGWRVIDHSKKPPDDQLRNDDGRVIKDPAMTIEETAQMGKQISQEISGGKLDGIIAIGRPFVADMEAADLGQRLKTFGLGDGKPIDLNDPEAINKARKSVDGLQAAGAIHPDDFKDLKAKLDQLEKDAKADKTGADGVAKVYSEKALQYALAEAKTEGKLPMVVYVDTSNEPFFTDSGGGAAGGSGGGHVITITDYDPATGKAKIQNQWANEANHETNVHELYMAMRPAGMNIKDLQDDAGVKNHTDKPKELELLRLKHDGGQLSDKDFDEQLTKLCIENYKQQKASGGLDDPNYKKLQYEELLTIVKGIPTARATAIFDAVNKETDNDLQKAFKEHQKPDAGGATAVDVAKHPDSVKATAGAGAGSDGAEMSKLNAAAGGDLTSLNLSTMVQSADFMPGTPGSDLARLQLEMTLATRLEAKDHHVLDEIAKKDPAVQKDIDAFKERAKHQDPPLSDQEVEKTLIAVEKILEPKGDWPTKESDRIKVAEQVLHHAADPTSINQGEAGCCQVTAAESRLFAKNPSAAADMIAQVAVTGRYMTHGDPPMFIKVDLDSLKLQGNPPTSSLDGQPKDTDRSYATQIFQVTAVNIAWATETNLTDDFNQQVKDSQGNGFSKGAIHYEQGPPGSPQGRPPIPPGDTGERLIDYSKTPHEPIKDSRGFYLSAPELDDRKITDITNQITGAKPPETEVVINNSRNVSDQGSLNTNGTTVNTEQDLKTELKKLHDEHKLPVVIRVDAGNEPFWSDSHGATAGGSGGAHFVTITDVTVDKNGDVKDVNMVNQWGKDSNHQMSAHDLFLATRPLKENIADLEKEKHKDPTKALELARLKHDTNQMTDAQYDAEIIRVAREAQQRASASGKPVDPATLKELHYMLGKLSRASATDSEVERSDKISMALGTNLMKQINAAA